MQTEQQQTPRFIDSLHNSHRYPMSGCPSLVKGKSQSTQRGNYSAMRTGQPGECYWSSVLVMLPQASRGLARGSRGGDEKRAQRGKWYCSHLQVGSVSRQNRDQKTSPRGSKRAVGEELSQHLGPEGFPDPDCKGKLSVGAHGPHHRQNVVDSALTTGRESFF